MCEQSDESIFFKKISIVNYTWRVVSTETVLTFILEHTYGKLQKSHCWHKGKWLDINFWGKNEKKHSNIILKLGSSNRWQICISSVCWASHQQPAWKLCSKLAGFVLSDPLWSLLTTGPLLKRKGLHLIVSQFPLGSTLCNLQNPRLHQRNKPNDKTKYWKRATFLDEVNLWNNKNMELAGNYKS